MKKVFYWSPCLSNVGTVSSTLNSAISLSKYSKKNYEAFIINVCGEWDGYADYLKDHNVKLINFRLKYFFTIGMQPLSRTSMTLKVSAFI